MAYTNFAAQLEALRNGTPSAEVFGGGMAGAPATGGTLNLGNMYSGWGVDPNANPFQGQLDKAFGAGNSPFLNYDQRTALQTMPGASADGSGTHMILDPATGQNVPAPGTYNPARPSTPGGGGMAGRGNAGMGSGYGLSTNPYEGAQANALAAQQQQFLDQNFNNIRSSAVGVGGLGGSREGVAQGTAIGQAATGLAGATANLYGQNWQADQNRALQQYLGDQGFYTAQRGLDQSGAALGANLYSQGTLGQWGPINQAGATYSPYTSNGNTTVNMSGGGGAMGAVGGALGTAQLMNNIYKNSGSSGSWW